MLCDKLNVYHHELRPNEYAEFHLKYEVDAAIEELKDENECLRNELRATRRALLLMCSKRAKAEAYAEDNMADLLLRGGTSRAVDYHRFERDKWKKKAEICKAKADEYK